MRILRLLLMKLVCRSVEFLTWEFSILCEEHLTRWYVESLILCRNSVYDVANLPMHLDCLSVLKIDKISGSRSVCLYATVCLYLHQRLAYSKSCAV